MVNSPEFRPELVETLRLSALAGAHLSETQVSMLMEKMPANHFMSAYGLSEIAPVTLPLYGDIAEHITQTVSKPIEGIDVKIQNPDTHEPCPAGTAGEILVQSHGLMCSYYKVPPEEQPFDDEVLGEAVAAAVILKDGYVFDEAGMREFLSTRLARFKIPAYFFVYEKFPALANGKIDTVSLTKELAEKMKDVN